MKLYGWYKRREFYDRTRTVLDVWLLVKIAIESRVSRSIDSSRDANGKGTRARYQN